MNELRRTENLLARPEDIGMVTLGRCLIQSYTVSQDAEWCRSIDHSLPTLYRVESKMSLHVEIIETDDPIAIDFESFPILKAAIDLFEWHVVTYSQDTFQIFSDRIQQIHVPISGVIQLIGVEKNLD